MPVVFVHTSNAGHADAAYGEIEVRPTHPEKGGALEVPVGVPDQHIAATSHSDITSLSGAGGASFDRSRTGLSRTLRVQPRSDRVRVGPRQEQKSHVGPNTSGDTHQST